MYSNIIKECMEKKNRIVSIFYGWILIQPFIDLLTSIDVRFEIFPVSVGIILRGIFLGAMAVYLVFINKKSSRTLSFVYLMLCAIYFALFIINKAENNSLIFVEITSIVKFFYFPIVFLGMYKFFDEYDVDYDKVFKTFVTNLIVISIMLLIPFITNTSFSSYPTRDDLTSVGWFFAPNEISAIMIMLFPFFFYRFYGKMTGKRKLALLYVTFAFTVFFIALLGTKVAFLGILIVTVIFLLYAVISRVLKKKRHGNVSRFSVFLLIMCLVLPVSPAFQNVANILSNMFDVELPADNDSTILSNRDVYLKENWSVFAESTPKDQLLGIGFTVRNAHEPAVLRRIVEIDFFDLFLSGGIIGTILFFLPILFILIKETRNFRIKNILRLKTFSIGISAGLCLMISWFAGHVFSSPAVSTYSAIAIVCLIGSFGRVGNAAESSDYDLL